MSAPMVSIITVNFNTTAVTEALLLSLQQISYPHWEVVVVDNGSREPCRMLAEKYPWIRYLETGENLGFAGGNNRGITICRGEYLLLLNNDTEVDPGFLEPLVQRLQQDHQIGMVCPKILYYESPDTIQFAGFEPINPITGRGFSIGHLEKDQGQYDLPRAISRAHGAAMMFSRSAMETVGMMAEGYFLYYEEMDYSERFRRAGYTIWYEPASRVWHKESMSTGKGSTLKTYYYGRNRLWYLRRNTPTAYRLPMYLYYYTVAVPKNLLGHVAKGEWNHVKAFWQGLRWNWSHGTEDPSEHQGKKTASTNNH